MAAASEIKDLKLLARMLKSFQYALVSEEKRVIDRPRRKSGRYRRRRYREGDATGGPIACQRVGTQDTENERQN